MYIPEMSLAEFLMRIRQRFDPSVEGIPASGIGLSDSLPAEPKSND